MTHRHSPICFTAISHYVAKTLRLSEVLTIMKNMQEVTLCGHGQLNYRKCDMLSSRFLQTSNSVVQKYFVAKFGNVNQKSSNVLLPEFYCI